MRSRPALLFALGLFAWSAAPAPAATGLGKFPPLVQFRDLVPLPPAAVFGPDNVVLLDARPRADYDAGHIPYAVWVDVKRAQEIAARPGGLTDRDAWHDWIAPLGLVEGERVRVMDGGRQLEAARVWWLLRYLGVHDVGLVDGNFPLWAAQRRPVTQDPTVVKPRPYPIDFQADRLATREQVLASLKSKRDRIVDARTVEEWTGAQLRAKRGGHMPTACRLEWTNFVDADGRFLPESKLKALIEAAGVRPGEAVIAHCQGGGRASVDAFVFEMLGYPTRNFYLGWSDWGNAEETPITTADEAPQATPAAAPEPAAKPFTVEYDYKCRWGDADEFLALFRKNHLPVLRERMKQGDILSVGMVKPRAHTGEADRWDFRVTLVFKDAAQAFNIAADEPIKRRLFPDQVAYKAEEKRRFAILEGHTDLPVEPVDLDSPPTAP